MMTIISLDEAIFLHALGVAAVCVVTVVTFIGVIAMAFEAIGD